MIKAKSYINGKWIVKKENIKIPNPANNEVVGLVPSLDKEDLELAFSSAKRAFSLWRMEDPQVRMKKIFKIVDLLEKNKTKLSKIMAYEIAKSISDSKKEIDRTIQYIKDTIKAYNNNFVTPKVIDKSMHKIDNKVAYINRIPLGVVVAISPFNYPVNLSLAKIIPALILGNTVVFKSATQGSLVGYFLAKIIAKLKLPIGVFNFVTGLGKKIGDILITNKNVAMISFTGSPEVGNNIAKVTSKIPLVLELGGKDAAIILSDANLEKAANEVLSGAFSYSGQRCTAIKRVIIHNDVADDFIKLLSRKVQTLKVGLAEKDAYITPLINSAAADYAWGLKEDAIKNKAKIVLDGKRTGNLIEPVILDYVSPKSKIALLEQFAPILPIIRFKKLQEAIKIHNSTEFGLQCSIFTEDIDQAQAISNYLEAGTININKASSRGPDIIPFIGIKNSGFGTQGILDALYSMSRIKPIIINK